MLPDLSPAHILIVVVVALIVVGPKDLPMLLRKIGQFMGKMRGMANEFRASFDEMARQSELDELRKEVEAMRAAANSAAPRLEAELGLNDEASNIGADYMAQWQAAQDAAEMVSPTYGVTEPISYVEPAPLKKARASKPKLKAAGAQAGRKAVSANKNPPEPVAKPKKAAAKAAPKPVKTVEAAAKPRAKKAKLS